MATLTAIYGESATSKFNEDTIYFNKKLNDLVELKCFFSAKHQRATAIEASIIEQRELISYLHVRDLADGESDDSGGGMAEQNFECMVVKWLHDNKQLNVAQNVALPADKKAILSYVKQYLNGRVWADQLAKQGSPELQHLFNNFVSDGKFLTDENGTEIQLRFQEIGLKVLGKWDKYKNI